MNRYSFLALPALLLTAAEAVTTIDSADDPSITSQLYRDQAAGFPSVGVVSGTGETGSGVLIGDRWVLTAGHVAESKAGGTFAIGGTNYSVASSIAHPDFLSGSLDSDLALLMLSTAVGNVPAAEIWQYSDSISMLGTEASWVGHGFVGSGRTGAIGIVQFRAFTNMIDVLGSHADYEGLPGSSFIADFDRPDGSTNAPSSSPSATRLEGNLAPGDSGGGVFVEIGGKPYLIGVNSYRATLDSRPEGTNSKYGALSGATNLQMFNSWITNETGIRAVPEPSILPLGSLGLLLGSLRRRRPASGSFLWSVDS